MLIQNINILHHTLDFSALPVASKLTEHHIKAAIENSTGKCSNFLKPVGFHVQPVYSVSAH